MKPCIKHGVYAVMLFTAAANCSNSSPEALNIALTFTAGQSAEQIPVLIDIPQDYEQVNIWDVQAGSGEIPHSPFAQRIQAPDDESRKTVLLLNPEQSGIPERMQIRLSPSDEETVSAFDFRDDGKTGVTLTEESRPVFTYNYGMMLPEGVPEDRRRSSYLHPVYGLDGEILTDDFPEDHYHHRGIFWAWPHVTVNGDSSSLWDIRGVRQQFEKWLGWETGPVFARCGVSNGWYMGEKKIMREDVWITVFRSGGAGRIIDFHFTFTPIGAAVSLLGAEGKGYGGFNCRFAPFTDPVITTNEGIRGKDSDRLRFPWADLSAKFAGGNAFSGISIFDNPANPETPNTWTLRHYGFLNPAWPSLEIRTIEPGKPLSLEYRVLIHRGGAAEGKVSQAYSVYTNPPDAGME